jgi:excisionase family DNA binding protein
MRLLPCGEPPPAGRHSCADSHAGGLRGYKLWTTSTGWSGACHTGTVPAARFLTLADVAEILAISSSQTYALVRNDELKAIKVGGRGQWRVEATALEDYIQRAYTQTAAWVSAHPFVDASAASDEADAG